jgi:hypothetical protein
MAVSGSIGWQLHDLSQLAASRSIAACASGSIAAGNIWIAAGSIKIYRSWQHLDLSQRRRLTWTGAMEQQPLIHTYTHQMYTSHVSHVGPK